MFTYELLCNTEVDVNQWDCNKGKCSVKCLISKAKFLKLYKYDLK